MANKNCTTCEFNAGTNCMGYGTRTDNGDETYGMPIESSIKMFPHGCEDYGISLAAFTEDCEKRNNEK